VELWDGASTSSATASTGSATASTGSATASTGSGTVHDGVYFYKVRLNGEGWSEELTGFVTVKK